MHDVEYLSSKLQLQYNRSIPYSYISSCYSAVLHCDVVLYNLLWQTYVTK